MTNRSHQGCSAGLGYLESQSNQEHSRWRSRQLLFNWSRVTMLQEELNSSTATIDVFKPLPNCAQTPRSSTAVTVGTDPEKNSNLGCQNVWYLKFSNSGCQIWHSFNQGSPWESGSALAAQFFLSPVIFENYRTGDWRAEWSVIFRVKKFE